MEYTKNDIELIKQFAEKFAEMALGARDRGADGFEFSFNHPETDEPFFYGKIEGKAFQYMMATPEGFADAMCTIAPGFLVSFKKAYKIEE